MAFRHTITKKIKDDELKNEIKRVRKRNLLKEPLREYEIREALYLNNGKLTKTARLLNVSLVTLYNYIDKFPKLENVINECQETILDETEEQLEGQVKAGNIQAIIFTLKTKGKSRGFVERTEVTGAEGKDLSVTIVPAKEAIKDGRASTQENVVSMEDIRAGL